MRRTLTLICSVLAATVWLAPSAEAQLPSTPPSWEYETSLDQSLYSAGAVTAGGELWVVGGVRCTSHSPYSCDGVATARVRSFDPGSREWIARPQLQTARYDEAVAADSSGALYAIGGSTGAGAVRSVERLAAGGSAWKPAAPLPVALQVAAAARGADGRIYVFGDEHATLVYDPGTDSWSSRPGGCGFVNTSSAVARVGSTFYVNAGGPARYDPATNTCTPLPRQVSPLLRNGAGVVAGSDGKVFFVGGMRKYETRFVDVWVPSANRWAPSTYLPFGDADHSVTLGPDGRIWTLGGHDDDFETFHADVYRLDISDHTAPQITSAPAPGFSEGTPVDGVSGNLPVSITWASTDNRGVLTTFLSRRTGTAPWHAEYQYAVPWVDGSSWLKFPVPGTPYTFRAQPVDGVGNIGAVVTGPQFTVRVRQETAASIAYTGSWTAGTSASALGGGLRFTAAAGAAAQTTFTGRSVTWIAPTAPGKGSARVYLDGALIRTVDLHTASTAAQQLVFVRTWPAVGTHTLRIVAVGDARIDLDAIGVID